MEKDIIIYGAYGYTGELIVRKCQELGVKPLLSGRSESKLKPVADKYGLPYHVASLNDADLDGLLQGAKVVIHAAGPFIHTSKPMVEACIRNKVHYTDITGEIAVFAQASKYDAQAKEAGVMLLPGTGFDVVPTDCMSAFLKSTFLEQTKTEAIFYCENGTIKVNTQFHCPTTVTIIDVNGKEKTLDFNYNTIGYSYEIKHFNQLFNHDLIISHTD